MIVKHLNVVTEIWTLAEIDTGTEVLTLSVRDGVITTRYAGMFSDAERHYPTKHADVEETAISGALLRRVAAILPEESDVVLARSGTSLRINCEGSQAAALRMMHSEEKLTIRPADGADTFRMEAAKLEEALTFLKELVSGGISNPVLTGIQFLGTAQGDLMLVGTDGQSQVGTVVFPEINMAPGEAFVAKTADLHEALTYFKTVRFTWSGTNLYLSSKRVKIRLLTLSGKFPSVKTLQTKFKHRVRLKAPAIETAVKAASFIDSEHVVRYVVINGEAAWHVRGQQIGEFVARAGSVDVPNFHIDFDAEWLAAVLKLPGPVSMRYNRNHEPALFTCKGYRCWVAPSVKIR